MTARPANDSQQPQIGVIDGIRFLCEVFAIVSLGIWGFVAFPFWLNIIVGIGAPILAIVLWGLFRAPKAVFRVDPFVKALIEGAEACAASHGGITDDIAVLRVERTRR